MGDFRFIFQREKEDALVGGLEMAAVVFGGHQREGEIDGAVFRQQERLKIPDHHEARRGGETQVHFDIPPAAWLISARPQAMGVIVANSGGVPP